METGSFGSGLGARRLLRGLLAMATAGLAAGVWALWHLDHWALTPGRAALRDGFCKNAPQMLVQRQSATTAIVVCQGLPGSLDGGHGVMVRLPWGLWWASPAGANFSYRPPAAASAAGIDYLHYGPTQSAFTTLILLGRSRRAEVAGVEARLSDGRTLTTAVRNGLFVLDAPLGAVGVEVDELRLVDANSRVIQRIALKPGA